MRASGRAEARGIFTVTFACAFAAACGSSGPGPTQAGNGGAGAGGVAATGGATTSATDAAIPPGSGGSGAGGAAGGTTTAKSDASVPSSGGVTGAGGATSGAGGTQTGAGGATTATGTGGVQAGTAGATGAGGSNGGGRSGSGGAGPGAGGTTGGTTAGAGGAPSNGGGGGGKDAGAGGSTGTATGGSAGSAGAVPSAGCGKAAPTTGRQTITVGGTAREFILKLPAAYDNTHPYRLIFGFHGAKYNDDWVATGIAPDGGTNLSGPWFGLESESAGSAIFVAPQANPTWGSSDLAFVDAMLAQFEAQLCIDQSRIFSVGFSMGAIMTITLGCNRPDVFRAIAPMSGSLPNPCPTGQHIAYFATHGTNDTTIPIANGEAARDEFVKRNHCGSQTSAPDGNNCVTYQGCDAGYPVIWCTFPGVHEPAPFAGPEIWQFLSPL
jgi:polyhydroxybutyrate depolymerase